ncbi:MAG: DUF3857 domain-containing protein [Imperialibacter sp.]|uniref:DUF3857 domain-containing protein n=1 Tax=Imperialibacter sp. TaxID=2038411 RepID=UPI003A84A561
MRQIFVLAAIVLNSYFAVAEKDVSVDKSSNWVTRVEYDDSIVPGSSNSYQYLLIQQEDHLPKETKFRRFVYKILNADGVQSMSDISVSFDPTYQRLVFHELNLIREGVSHNKLSKEVIKIYQRETSMDRSLYDGSLTAVINLEDVRENDIIDYSYSLIGFNPINGGHFSANYYQQFSVPVNSLRTKVINDPSKFIQFKLFNAAESPRRTNAGGMDEYSWTVNAKDYLLVDNNIPTWYDPHRRVSFSTFKSWEEVVAWALPLYQYPESEVQQIEFPLSSGVSKEVRIASLIQKVQDEVRYLGFESGIGAYKPHNPVKVYEQRFGDCKDKSLLLVALLRKIDVVANPMLVNTAVGHKLGDELPGFSLFDHCVVSFSHNGEDYFVDPTISNQGGNIELISFPNYEFGLEIKKGTSALREVATKNLPTIKINEVISVESIGGGAAMHVRTEYTGSRADYIRSYFASNSFENIKKEYLNYYSSLYPHIASSGDVKFYDYDRLSKNKIIVEEFYEIEKFWVDSDDKEYILCEAYPLVLESYLNYPKAANHEMPYYLGQPYSYIQDTQIDLPEDWSGEGETINLGNEAFDFSKTTQIKGRTVSVSFRYDLKKSFISGDSVNGFLQKIENVKTEMPQYLTYNENLAASASKVSWVSSFLAVVSLFLGVFFAVRTYKTYDPEPWEFAEDKPIGGWLILPAIGLTLTPIRLVIDLLSNDQLSAGMWDGIILLTDGGVKSLPVLVFVGAELVYNYMFFVFSILIIVLFYQRRTSVPRLVTIFYALALIVPIVDALITDELIPGVLSETDRNSTIKEAVRAGVAALIWIPYFNIAERVKSTFCKKRIN